MSQSTGIRSPINRLLPYTFLCTIGPSVTAATSLYVVRYLVCRYYWLRQSSSSDPSPGDAICNNPSVEALTGSVMAGLATIDGLVSFFSTSYVQRLADRLGRRTLLIALPLLATISTSSMMIAFATKNPVSSSNRTRPSLTPSAEYSMDTASDERNLCVGVHEVGLRPYSLRCRHRFGRGKIDRTRFYSRLEAVAVLGPGLSYIASALASRYIPNVIFTYYLALGAQVLAALYAFAFIPETLPAHPKEDEEYTSDSASEDHELTTAEELIAPIKPLALLLPHRDGISGQIRWKLFCLTISLFTTTSGTVFIATASLLFLSDKFNFNPEKNAWVLAYLTFSRFAYLVLFFPLILKFGRRGLDAYTAWRAARTQHGEQQALLADNASGESKSGEEANHFDVILAFASVLLDAASLVLVSISQSYQQVLGSFSVLALGAGDNPTFKSVFVSAVPPEHASEALAALDMVLSAAKLASPPILGGLYSAFVRIGRPELLFLCAGVSAEL
ncbi:hypothetical protein P7C73_g3615, partial [Tremellales sp. Uapishka_1]